VRAPRSIRFLVAAALGVAAVALPATAASEGTPTIETEDPVHHWKPPTATIEAGGAIVFKNASTTVAHGIRWISAPAAPTCEPSVPVGTSAAASGTNWTGGCTFAVAGTYTFYCTVHGASMSGTITVNAAGAKEPPGETTPTGTAPTTTPGAGTTPGASSTPGGSAPAGGAGASAAAASAAALSALRITVPRHAGALHGSLLVPAADAGGRLQVELLAARSALATGGVRVGQLVRRGISAGRLAFKLTPSARALRALRRRGSLKPTMTAELGPASGAGASVSRRLTLRR
jgi:plastocyanin